MIKLKDIIREEKYRPDNKVYKISKQLSYILRHSPESIGISIDEAGWVSTKELLEKIGITMDTLLTVVRTNDKKRFEFNSDRSKIRASQGHSIEVDLQYVDSQPPAVLYHGTSKRFLQSIQQQGLTKQSRHHVHLSDNKPTASAVGSRHGGETVILTIDSGKMYSDGIKFYKSTNNVWLTDRVPFQYISAI